MYQKDFILRIIEMIAEFIGRVLGLIKDGKYEEASEELNVAYEKFLKDNNNKIRSCSDKELVSLLVEQLEFGVDEMEGLANLIYTEGELHAAQNKHAEAKSSYYKSLLLYTYVENNSKTFSFPRQQKLTELKEKLDNYNS